MGDAQGFALAFHAPWSLFAYDFQRHRSDQFVEIIGHVRSEKGHEPRLVTVQVIIPGENHVADVIAVEAGDARTEAVRVKGILDAERQFAAEIARSRYPNGVGQAEDLD